MPQQLSPLAVGSLPLMLTMDHVNQRHCLECESRATYVLDSVGPINNRPMKSRICDDCGRVTSAYEN